VLGWSSGEDDAIIPSHGLSQIQKTEESELPDPNSAAIRKDESYLSSAIS